MYSLNEARCPNCHEYHNSWTLHPALDSYECICGCVIDGQSFQILVKGNEINQEEVILEGLHREIRVLKTKLDHAQRTIDRHKENSKLHFKIITMLIVLKEMSTDGHSIMDDPHFNDKSDQLLEKMFNLINTEHELSNKIFQEEFPNILYEMVKDLPAWKHDFGVLAFTFSKALEYNEAENYLDPDPFDMGEVLPEKKQDYIPTGIIDDLVSVHPILKGIPGDQDKENQDKEEQDNLLWAYKGTTYKSFKPGEYPNG